MLVVSADISEMAGFFGVNSIPNLLDSLKTMEIQNIPDALSLPSLSAGYMKVGDMLALPMGTLAITKAINGDCVGLRTVVQKFVHQFRSISLPPTAFLSAVAWRGRLGRLAG